MDASELRYRIIFKTLGAPDVEKGVLSHEIFYKCFANVEEKASVENYSESEGGRIAEIKTHFTIRRNPKSESITPTMIIEHGGVHYDITPGVKTLESIKFEGVRRVGE